MERPKIKIEKEKLKNIILETVFCICYCFILCIFTYILKYDKALMGVEILGDAMQVRRTLSIYVITISYFTHRIYHNKKHSKR